VVVYVRRPSSKMAVQHSLDAALTRHLFGHLPKQNQKFVRLPATLVVGILLVHLIHCTMVETRPCLRQVIPCK